jgi:pimeloyl-ACP methyl ester carboxylesterase/DNA-binding CsgD family transcriptional regulator
MHARRTTGGFAQDIRFCTAADGAALAYACSGHGRPLVKTANWLTHLEFDPLTSFWRPWLDALSAHHRLVRFDQRGCGLSDAAVGEPSVDAWVADLEAVVDAAALGRFALLGMSQGGAIAVEFARRHPDRVTHLVLYGAYGRGRAARATTAEQRAEFETQLKLIEVGWGSDDPAYRSVFAQQFFPDASLEQIHEFAELARQSCPAATARRLLEAFGRIDIRNAAAQLRCPALVLHARHDRRVPFEEGRLLAQLIPRARFVPLDSRNHVLTESEPAWRVFVDVLEAFLDGGGGVDTVATRFDQLTPRERQVLTLVAEGLDNAGIAQRLGLSAKTVRNHVSSVLDKLGVPTRALAIVRAREAGFARGG